MSAPLGDANAKPTLRWDAPASCPSARAFEHRLASLHTEPLRADVTVHVRIRQLEEHHFDLAVTLHSTELSDTRTAQADRCEVLADAAALVVASIVDPLAPAAVATTIDHPEPQPSPTPPDEATSRAPLIRDRTPPPRPSPRDELRTTPTPADDDPPDRFGLGVGWQGGRAAMPALDLGPILTFGWQRGQVRVEATGSVLLPQRYRFRARPEVTLRTWMAAGSLSAHVVVPVNERLELPVGMGLEAGGLVARGEGIDRPRTTAGPWGAAFGAARLVWRPTSRWGLWAGVSMVVALARPTFTVADQGPMAAGAGGLRGALGLEWQWIR